MERRTGWGEGSTGAFLLGTADKPVSVTKDNVLNFIATALFVNRANMKPIEFPEAFGKRPSASFRD